MFVCSFVCLFICLSVPLCFCSRICLSVCLSVYFYTFVYVYLYMSVYPSICLFVYVSLNLSISLLICLSVCSYICLLVHLSSCLLGCLWGLFRLPTRDQEDKGNPKDTHTQLKLATEHKSHSAVIYGHPPSLLPLSLLPYPSTLYPSRLSILFLPFSLFASLSPFQSYSLLFSPSIILKSLSPLPSPYIFCFLFCFTSSSSIRLLPYFFHLHFTSSPAPLPPLSYPFTQPLPSFIIPPLFTSPSSTPSTFSFFPLCLNPFPDSSLPLSPYDPFLGRGMESQIRNWNKHIKNAFHKTTESIHNHTDHLKSG